ncbi:MAG: hypothetical protein AAGF88_11585, partial [Pseudomonadota bacterium]
LPNRIPAQYDLMHRIALELVAVIACPHLGLLASKLGGKASTNLGAPHSYGSEFVWVFQQCYELIVFRSKGLELFTGSIKFIAERRVQLLCAKCVLQF